MSDNAFNPFDPTGMFKELRDVSMDAWSKMMVQFVNSEAYAQASGQMLDTWLANSSPFRRQLEASMAQSLANLNLPSRDEITRLATRLTNIEMRLDDLDAKLDQLLPTTAKKASAAKPVSANGEHQ